MLFRSHKRANKTLKANAFLPAPNGELSVTRHIDATEEELWSLGEKVASARKPPKELYGRGDVSVFRSEERRVGKECRSRWSPYH